METAYEWEVLDETRSRVELAILATVVADISLMDAMDPETLSQVADHLLLRLQLDLSLFSLLVVISLAVLLVIWVLNDGLMCLRRSKVGHRRLRVSSPVQVCCGAAAIQRIKVSKVVAARRVLIPLPEHQRLHIGKVPLLRSVLISLRTVSLPHGFVEDQLLC